MLLVSREKVVVIKNHLLFISFICFPKMGQKPERSMSGWSSLVQNKTGDGHKPARSLCAALCREALALCEGLVCLLTCCSLFGRSCMYWAQCYPQLPEQQDHRGRSLFDTQGIVKSVLRKPFRCDIPDKDTCQHPLPAPPTRLVLKGGRTTFWPL